MRSADLEGDGEDLAAAADPNVGHGVPLRPTLDPGPEPHPGPFREAIGPTDQSVILDRGSHAVLRDDEDPARSRRERRRRRFGSGREGRLDRGFRGRRIRKGRRPLGDGRFALRGPPGSERREEEDSRDRRRDADRGPPRRGCGGGLRLRLGRRDSALGAELGHRRGAVEPEMLRAGAHGLLDGAVVGQLVEPAELDRGEPVGVDPRRPAHVDALQRAALALLLKLPSDIGRSAHEGNGTRPAGSRGIDPPLTRRGAQW